MTVPPPASGSHGDLVAPPSRLLEMVYDNMSDGVVIAETTGRILYVNPAILLLLGLSATEMAGTYWSDVFPEGSRPTDAGAASTSTIFEVARKDGRKRTLLAKSFELSSQPPLRVTILRDITRRRQAQAKLIESERRFRSIVEGFPVPVVLCLARDRRIQYANDRTADLFLAPAESLLDQHVRVLFYDQADFEALERALEERGIVRDVEVLLRTRKGSTVWAVVNAQRIDDADQPALLISFLDISERRRAEQRLRRNEGRYRTAIAQAEAVSYLLDVDATRYDYIDPGIKELTGYTAAEFTPAMRDAILLEVVPLGMFAGMTPADARSLSTAGRLRWRADYRIRARNGEERWITDSAVPIEEEQEGKGARYLGILQDITERKRAETALWQAQQRAHQSQKLEALGRLAGVVSHDFSNLLAAIGGNCQLGLEQTSNPELVHDILEDIADAVALSSGLVRQLLDFCRDTPARREVVDVNEVLGGMERLIQRFVGDAIVVTLEPAAESLLVEVDRSQLEQVLMNLVVNSRDAMTDGGQLTVTLGTIDVTAPRPELAAGSYVRLEVADTGSGISPEILPKIFDPFFTTKGPGRGTGLGLSAVHGIVRQFGGIIDVQSTPGQGARFRVLLPRTTATGPVAVPSPLDQAVLVPTPEPDEVSAASQRRILLVDDDDSVRAPTVLYLRRKGFLVYEARCGEEALQVLRNQTPTVDLLVTDLIMPGMDGVQLIDEFHRLCPGVEAILMSGYLFDLSSEALGGAVADVIAKPFSPRDLLERIEVLLGRRG
ncbi:MAG: PAS domain S-box protein [Candidatus Sumerlaeia bacterium]|nr:PAS domain S-box protein [Candidatus Sumerlaeia bacterium]